MTTILPATTSLEARLCNKINNRTKPLQSLGRLEEIALQIGLIQQTEKPEIISPHIVVFAGDHGIAATGLVNPYPQAVTAQMVKNFLQGGAAINTFCRQSDIQLKVVDAGVNFEWDEELNHPHFINAKMGLGTANYLSTTAMDIRTCQETIDKGREIVRGIALSGSNTIGFGEMGIGNSSSAALIMSVLTGLPIESCAGRGTGANDEQLRIKIETLKKVLENHSVDALQNDIPMLLSTVGGFEIVMMCGAYLEAFQQDMVIVVDGFIATSALLAAYFLEPGILKNCIFAHVSKEQGHQLMLNHLGVSPLLNLHLSLGEGTGAALAIPLIRSAVAFLNEMASFEEAGVNKRI